MTEREMIEYYRKQIVGNSILRNAISEQCEFWFGKEASLEVEKERLMKDRKCDSEIYPFGRDGKTGIYVLVNDTYVGYIDGDRSAQICGIVARNVREFFNLMTTCKSLRRYFISYKFENISTFNENYDEANYFLSGSTAENEAIENFIKENEFKTDIKDLYEMFKSAITTDPEFIIEDPIYNAKVNDLFRSNHEAIEKIRNYTNTNKIIKKTSISNLPKFKYHPNLYDDAIVIFDEGTCECCGKEVSAFIENIYSSRDLYCICLECIANGAAAKKFKCEFVQDAEKVSDPEKVDELFHRTPGYSNWQGEYWLACCDDYCQYIGMVRIDELDELGITKEVLKEYSKRENSYPIEDVQENLDVDGSMTGYLFKCSHCGKYHLWVDEC